jgi:glycosyltransferase involved in cell wall biosynthesis
MKIIRLLAIVEATSITGPAKNLLNFAELARSGHFRPSIEVSVAAFQRGTNSNLFLDTVRARAIPLFPIAETGRFDRSVLDKLRALVRELQPDIIQTHAVKSHLLLRMSGLWRTTPWIAFHHGYTWPDMRARLYNQLDRWSLRAARRVVTVSLPFRDQLLKTGVSSSRIEIIHNAIDPPAPQGISPLSRDSADALRAKLGIAPDRKVILIVGRLSKEKDHETLLEVMRRLKDSASNGTLPTSHLLIVGDGVERPRIEKSITRLELGGSVTLAGQVPSAQPYYGIAAVSVLSSLSEGSPNALLESMAAGVPVVATAVGGVPEIVTGGRSALLVRPRDVEGMTEALSRLLRDQPLAAKIAAAAYQTVQERYLPEGRTERLIRFYEALLPSTSTIKEE